MLLCEEVKLMQKLPYFAAVDPCKLKLLAFASERVKFAPGQRLFTEGERGDAAYLILSGTVDLLVDTPTGPIKVAKNECHSIIGDICLLCDGTRTATAKAATPVEALKIDRDYLFKIMDDCPSLRRNFTQTLAEKLRTATVELDQVRALQKV